MALVLLPLVFIAFILIGGTAQLLSLGWGLWFSEVFVFVGLPVIALRLLGEPVPSLRAPSVRVAAFGFAAGAINYFAAAVPLMSLAHALFPQSYIERFDSSVIFQDRSTLEMALIIAGVSIAAPVGEEIFFRGVFQPRLDSLVGPARSIFFTALIFSFFHLDPVGFMARLELGALFGFLAWRTGSLWPGIFAHAANNLVSTVAYFLSRDVESNDEQLSWYVPTVMAVMGCVALWSLWRNRPMFDTPPLVAAAPPAQLGRVIAPWAVAAVLSIALLGVFDGRQVSLNVFDAFHPVSKDATAELKPLRARARAGEVELEAYYEARRAMKR